MQTSKSVLKSRNISPPDREQKIKVAHLETYFKINTVSKLGSETFYKTKCI